MELYDVRVEGAQAVEQIVEAIEYFNEHTFAPTGASGPASRPEVLVLTRGGGSLESLQAFNAEAVVRAIFASQIPIISAVGHEKDVTVADFVADVRASTPTHAGKIISEDWERASVDLEQLQTGIVHGAQNIIVSWRNTLETLSSGITTSFEYYFDSFKLRLVDFSTKLNLVSPELKLKQGYSIVLAGDGSVIKSVDQLAVGDRVKLRLHKGTAGANIYEKN